MLYGDLRGEPATPKDRESCTATVPYHSSDSDNIDILQLKGRQMSRCLLG